MSKYEEALDFISKYAEEQLGQCSHYYRDHELPVMKARLQELVDRATPKRPTQLCCSLYICPRCETEILKNIRRYNCGNCGQALDWGVKDVE